MSNSVRSQRQQPIRLPCHWDSPDKNTGVGCHFLLQCMKVKIESEVAQLCPTLNDPMDCSPPGSSVHGVFQARALEWGTIAFSRKASTSALLTMLKPLTVWITTKCGKLFKRQEYQTTLPASWEICMQVKKQQLESDMKQWERSMSRLYIVTLLI